MYTNGNETIAIKVAGTHNHHAGPDFFNAKIEIDGQLWVGNVEMHLKSSDWYAHHHETDSNYDNVILHVVWEDDVAVFRRDGSQIPTLELKQYVSKELLGKYQGLLENYRPIFINCEKDLRRIDSFLVENWLHRLYIERLEHKSQVIFDLLKKSNNDWEGTLFIMLAKNFGSKVNGEFFLDRASQLDFSIIRKLGHHPHQLESLLFGHFGLLHLEDCSDTYYLQLKKEYEYLSSKFGFTQAHDRPEFFGLRPTNFPTIRISQLANLYTGNQQLFSEVMELASLEEIYKVFETATHSYWETHFTFGKPSKAKSKKLSKSFIDLIVINTIVPIKFCYAKHLGKDWNEGLISLMSQLDGEVNSIIANFGNMGSPTQNALESQAKIELYTNYCSKNKCLQCALGTHLLNRNI